MIKHLKTSFIYIYLQTKEIALLEFFKLRVNYTLDIKTLLFCGDMLFYQKHILKMYYIYIFVLVFILYIQYQCSNDKWLLHTIVEPGNLNIYIMHKYTHNLMHNDAVFLEFSF